MTKIDINAIKPGEWPEGVNYIQTDTERWSKPHGDKFPWHLLADTAAEPEPVAEWVTEWVTEEEWMPGGKEEYALHHRFSLKYINRLLTRKYGPPPVIKTATGEEEGEDYVWTSIHRGDLESGDRYVEVPKCCGEGV